MRQWVVSIAILLIVNYVHPTVILAQNSIKSSANLEMTGAALQAPMVFTADALKAFPSDAIQSFSQTRASAGVSTTSTVRGVQLPALIERVGLTDRAKANWKTLLVICTATDGYRAVFTWPELSNTAVGAGVLVVFEQDGNPLAAREGQIALLSTADKRLGARHVRNLQRIELQFLPN